MAKNFELPISREDLYQLVWSEPMLRVAERFGVSSSYLARVCTNLNIPRPQRGYWAKLAVGKTLPVPPLPEAKIGDPIEWTKDSFPRSAPIKNVKPQSTKERATETVRIARNGEHSLLRNSRPLYTKCRFSHDAGYLRPDKRNLADIIVSEPSLDRALSYMHKLFLTLENRGHRVLLAPSRGPFRRVTIDEKDTPHNASYYQNLWHPARCTIVYIGEVAVGLTLVELVEEVEMIYLNGNYIRKTDITPEIRRKATRAHSWETTKSITCGRFRLFAYSPYPYAEWLKTWDEPKNQGFTKFVPDIVETLEQIEVELLTRIKEGEIRSQLQRFKWEIELEESKRQRKVARILEAKQESVDQLLEAIVNWDESERIRRFFSEAEKRARSLGEEDKTRILCRLNLAKKLIDSSDPSEVLRSWRTPEELLKEKKNHFYY